MKIAMFVDAPEGTKLPQSAEEAANLLTGIAGGQGPGDFFDSGSMLGETNVLEGVLSLYDLDDEDSHKVLSLIDRLLADDWTGSGVYEALDQALSAAEAAVSQ
jgi:hypothetical protein